ncbi:glycosyltransferase [Pseudoalteromonas sp. C2R02]|uniref:glycosyltransferase n=1 Tax=Pseudoalteromonas sp. C2R02 TaxID=2841565 RepID=UPI001C09D73E|nr:glycosyltransferase [Pseudoalteromonas sp. C2R02]MBU2972649.1 glycosyltransferase [Pseudoalteromonas sp. C2R02]
MINVLHIGKYYSPFHGGIENYTKDLVESDVYQSEVNASLLVHQHLNNKKTQNETIKNVKVNRIKKWFTLLYSPISPSFIKELNRTIKTQNPDVLHIHMPNLSAFFCLFSARARSIPWVIHWHSDVLGAVPDWRIKIAYKGYKIFERLLLKKSAAIIATSPNYLESSKPLSDFKNKSYVVPLGLSKVVTAAPVVKNNPKLSLLIVGRLTYYKGHKYLLHAMANLPNVELNIIGVGELEVNLKQLVLQFELTDRVNFLGSVDDNTLNNRILNCDLLCLPSIEKTEAFGLVLLEAARLSKPALVTSVEGSGMSWVVQDQVTGIVIEPHSSCALYDALNFAQKNKELLINFGKAANTRFNSDFSIAKTAKKILDVYRNI